MDDQNPNWKITCRGDTLARCRADEKFAYIVTLARAANALQSAQSILQYIKVNDTPAMGRDGFNAYLFASAILYEALQLIRKMNQVFKDDVVYQNGLRLLLKDKAAQQIESDHLNRARKFAIFHFDPEIFRETINKSPEFWECVFTSAIGKKKGDIYHGYADEVAAEILVGALTGSEGFEQKLADAMRTTSDLTLRFAAEAENLIGENLAKWGFRVEPR